jgi:glycosyltransferase involved in cell wall biosynthesis
VFTRAGRGVIQECITKINPDIVHSHDTYGFLDLKLSCPEIFTIHGFIHGDIQVSTTRWRKIKALIWRYFELRAWSQKNHLVSISPYVREFARHHTEARIFDIDNPVGRQFFSCTRSYAEQPRIFCSGVICRRKNQLQLLEAVGILRDRGRCVRLVLAGAASETDYAEKFVMRIEELDLQDQVEMLGNISSEQVKRELSKTSVFALVSREENSPISIMEAMAAGVPVITSNRCGMPYMVEHGVTGFLVNEKNATDIADKLQAVLSSQTVIESMGARGLEVAVTRFHPDVVAKKTVRAYAEITG